MKILPVKLNNYIYHNNSRNRSFKGVDNILSQESRLKRGQFVSNGIIHNFHYTSYARPDINWVNFGEYLKGKYPDGDIYVFEFASSTGQESYTTALLLNKIYPDKKIKIKAMDIDSRMVEESKKLQQSEIIPYRYVLYLNSELNLNKEESSNSFYQIDDEDFKFQPKISDMIEFETGNILEFPFERYKDKPSIVLMRNMWTYVNEDEHKPFARYLYKSLALNSTVVIGNIDLLASMRKKLLLAGFKPPSEYIDEKNRKFFLEKV